jgi:hypothetical protein
MTSAHQVAERFCVGRAVGYARLAGLVRLGLLEHRRVFHGIPGVYLATRAGLDLADVDLPPARLDVRTYDHDLELSSLVIELESEFGPDQVVTEREMRAQDTPLNSPPAEEPRFAVRLQSGRGQLQLTPVGHPRLHFPDCAVTGRSKADGLVVVELERSRKGSARLRGILSAYVAARHIGSVRYVATGKAVADLVRTQVAALNAEGFIEVAARSDALPPTRTSDAA